MGAEVPGVVFSACLSHEPRSAIQIQSQGTLSPTEGGTSFDKHVNISHLDPFRHHFADKGLSSQSYGFPVVMHGYESWIIKKAEGRRIDAFEMWC